MSWKSTVITALEEAGLFENSMHRSRMKELVDCYSNSPLFTRGMCKTMYLGAWDDEHFCELLSMLTQITYTSKMDIRDMDENGSLLAEETDDYGAYIYQLSCAFLEDRPFDMEALPKDLNPEGLYKIKRALLASVIIDDLKD